MRTPVPASALTVDGKPGIKVSYSKLDMTQHQQPEAMKPAGHAHRADARCRGSSIAPGSRQRAARWLFAMRATLTAPETGDYNLGLKASGFFRMQLDGKSVTSAYRAAIPTMPSWARVHLEAGKPAALRGGVHARRKRKARRAGWSGRRSISGRSRRPSKRPRTPTSSSPFSASPASSKAKRCR